MKTAEPAMTDQALKCGQCGSPLEVSPTTFSVACEQCGQWHLIDRSEDPPIAKPFEDAGKAGPDEPVEPAESEVARDPSELEEELDRLDRQWQWERQKHLVFGSNGSMTEPSYAASAVFFLIGVGAGGLLIQQAGEVNLIGGALLLAGVGFGILRFCQARTFRQALQKYFRKRRASSKPRN